MRQTTTVYLARVVETEDTLKREETAHSDAVELDTYGVTISYPLGGGAEASTLIPWANVGLVETGPCYCSVCKAKAAAE